MKTKIEIRFFFLPDFEKEALYLAEQHRKGWKFVENRFGMLFIFEKCQPEEVVYQLDFKPSLQEEYCYHDKHLGILAVIFLNKDSFVSLIAIVFIMILNFWNLQELKKCN